MTEPPEPKLLFDTVLENDKEDLLGTTALADSVESIISLAGDKTFSIATYGSWGTGKTNLLRMLERRFKDDNIVIWFDTWKYEKQPDLLLPLLKKLHNKVKGKKFKAINLKQLGETLIKVLIGVISTHYLKTDLSALGSAFSNSKSMIAKFDDQVELFCDRFKDYTKEILEETGKKRIIILFDDLDRCNPESTVALIESVKLFLAEGKNVTFIYALDKEIVSKAIRNHYSGIELFEGERYLEKVFDISLNLPKIDAPKADKYLTELDSTLTPEQKEYLKALCQHPKVNTPRVIKKIVNKIMILEHLRPKKRDAFPATDFWYDFQSKTVEIIQERKRQYISKDNLTGFCPPEYPNELAHEIAEKCQKVSNEIIGYIVLAETFGKFRKHLVSLHGQQKFYELIKLFCLTGGTLRKIVGQGKLAGSENKGPDQQYYLKYIEHMDEVNTFWLPEIEKLFYLIYPPLYNDTRNQPQRYFKICIELEIYEMFLSSFGL